MLKLFTRDAKVGVNKQSFCINYIRMKQDMLDLAKYCANQKS